MSPFKHFNLLLPDIINEDDIYVNRRVMTPATRLVHVLERFVTDLQISTEEEEEEEESNITDDDDDVLVLKNVVRENNGILSYEILKDKQQPVDVTPKKSFVLITTTKKRGRCMSHPQDATTALKRTNKRGRCISISSCSSYEDDTDDDTDEEDEMLTSRQTKRQLVRRLVF